MFVPLQFIRCTGPTAEGIPKNYNLRAAKEEASIHSFAEDSEVVSKCRPSCQLVHIATLSHLARV